MSCGNNETEKHEHTWIADGESWKKTDHHDSCPVTEYDSGMDKALAMKNCDCESCRVRRYTCHCGEMKEVKYND